MPNPNNGNAAIKYGQSGYSNPKVEANGRKILLSVTDNPYFPEPVPTLIVFSAAIENFSALCAIAKDGTKNDIRMRRDSRKSLEKLIKKLYEYVTITADGDAIILGASGFKLQKKREPKPPIADPTNLKVSNAGSGNINIGVDAVKNGKLYFFQYTIGPLTDDSNWITITDTKSKYVLTGLKPGTNYLLRVGVAGVKGQMKYSMVTSLICS